MARRCVISTDGILEVARALFLERGADVTTAEIARCAGVSEGSIFRRFPTKQALFLAAVGVNEEPGWIAELERYAGGDLRQNLQALTLEIIEFMREMVPCMILLHSNRELSDPDGIKFEFSAPARAVRAMTAFFDGQMKAGRMRLSHPETTARVFLGSIANFTFFEVMGIEVSGPLSATTFSHCLVDTIWQGIKPPSDLS